MTAAVNINHTASYMRLPKSVITVFLSAFLALAVSSCRNYSTVSTKRPTYLSDTSAGQIISKRLKHPSEAPLVQIGGYLDAADAAGKALKGNPGDMQARADYNFAVARAIEAITTAQLQPWKAPLRCPGAGGDWLFTYKAGKGPEWDPANYLIRPSDRFEFKGSLVKQRTIKEGLGAPMVVNSKGFDSTTVDPFSQGKQFFYGLTAIVSFKGRSCEALLLDPLASETVTYEGHAHPLAADFTAPIGLALAELKPGNVEVKGMFAPEKFRSSTRLARLQPYDPKKIPVLLVHGLGDSQATWAPMVESLRGDATFRNNYQVWFFSYPTGYPYPLMASVLRQQMDAINRRYPDHKPIVVIGHSMGGMISRTLITDSGLNIWNRIFNTPPERTPLSKEAHDLMTKALIFQHRPEIARVIFCSASLGGSDMATGALGRLGADIIGSPSDLLEVGKEVAVLSKPRDDGEQLKNIPNSIQLLDPKNRFVTAINKIPPAKGIPYHSVIADRGKGGNLNRTPPISTDGIVPYWSSHINGAQSERIVPSDHWSNRSPEGIAEVRRILLLHLKTAGGAASPSPSKPKAKVFR